MLLLERNAGNESINVNTEESHNRSGNLGYKSAPIAMLQWTKVQILASIVRCYSK